MVPMLIHCFLLRTDSVDFLGDARSRSRPGRRQPKVRANPASLASVAGLAEARRG
jgi:hypothetical protein